MPISVTCRGCEKRYRVQDDLAGRKIRCPKCREVIVVPESGDDWREDAVCGLL
jgi:predicted Zn finger-like uncharacterized protein